MSHPIRQRDQSTNTKSHNIPQYYKEKATQMFDENVANKALLIIIATTLNKQC